MPRKIKHDSTKYLANFSKEMDDALIKACKRGVPSALQLYYKVMGRLVEKQETKVEHTLSADELFRIRQEAQRKIGIEPKGETEVIENIDWEYINQQIGAGTQEPADRD